MSPIMFEAILFLKVNRTFWYLTSLILAMNGILKLSHPEIDDDSFYSSSL